MTIQFFNCHLVASVVTEDQCQNVLIHGIKYLINRICSQGIRNAKIKLQSYWSFPNFPKRVHDVQWELTIYYKRVKTDLGVQIIKIFVEHYMLNCLKIFVNLTKKKTLFRENLHVDLFHIH